MSGRRGGFSLLELVVYMGLLAGLCDMAYVLFARGFQAQGRLRACAQDVEAALDLSRDLRADLRQARGAAVLPDGTLRIAQPGGEVVYRGGGGEVLRTSGRSVRPYRPAEAWRASREPRLVRVVWQAPRHDPRGDPPRFEVAVALPGEEP